MPKTVSISDKTHDIIVKKQEELYKKRKFTIRITDIIGIIVEKHMNELENDLGLRNEKEQEFNTTEKS